MVETLAYKGGWRVKVSIQKAKSGGGKTPELSSTSPSNLPKSAKLEMFTVWGGISWCWDSPFSHLLGSYGMCLPWGHTRRDFFWYKPTCTCMVSSAGKDRILSTCVVYNTSHTTGVNKWVNEWTMQKDWGAFWFGGLSLGFFSGVERCKCIFQRHSNKHVLSDYK